MPTPTEIIEQDDSDWAAAGPTAIANNLGMLMNAIGAAVLDFFELPIERGWTKVVAAMGEGKWTRRRRW